MATPKGDGAPPADDESVPIARIVSQDRGGHDGVPVVVGQRVPAPTTGAYAVATSAPAAAANNIPVATAHPPSSSAAYTAPVMHNSTGTWTMPGSSTSSGGAHGGGMSGGTASGSMRGSSGSWGGASGSGGGGGGGGGGSGGGGGGAAAADGVFLPVMSHTGTRNLPGCGTASSTGGRRFGEEGGGGGAQVARSGPGRRGGGIVSVEEDGQYVADGGPVLIASGQGKSMYDVKGCLSSWVLLDGGGGGGPKGGVSEKRAAAGGAAAAGSGGQVPDPSWALRSDVNAAGDGGVMCSACVPSATSGRGGGSRMLITGGKDSVLREWDVAEGCPRMVAEISGHTDWISCCALIPSSTAGYPPSTCASGGRDGSVRFWSKSAAAAAAAPPLPHGKQVSKADKTSILRAAFASGSRSSSGRGGEFVGSGGGGGGGGPVPLGDGGWSLGSCMAAAHGSSEFVTCCATPGGSAVGGWVATGGTDWSVRLWDVAKCRELGRLSFMGHSHPVRSLASSPDGNLLVSGGDDHKVIVWSPQSRRPLATLKGHASAVHGVAVDPGATHSGHAPRWVASGGGEGFLLVWDPRNWKSPVATLRGEVEADAGTGAASTSALAGGGGGAFSSSSRTAGSSVAGGDAEGSLKGGLAGARLRGESGRWEGETTGATMLNGVNCLASGGAGGAGGGAGDWLFAAGETVVRSWQRRDGVWHGGAGLRGEGLGGVASLSVVE